MNMLLDSVAVLSFGLLAILIPVFVFAVSLLGRAIEKSTEEKQQKEIDLKKKLELTSRNLREISAKVNDTGKTDELEKEIKERKEAIKRYEKELAHIRSIPVYLTVRGCIISPGWRFLIAFIISTITKQSSFSYHFKGFIISSFLLNIVSLIFFFWGFFIIYQCLITIQNVSLTTDQAQFKRMVDAFETALKEHENKKMPKFDVVFNKKLPVILQKSSNNNIEWSVSLVSGVISSDTEVWFALPKEFTFVDHPGNSCGAYPDYSEECYNLGDLKAGLRYHRTTKVVTPSSAGKFKGRYFIVSKESKNEWKEFDIEVS